MSVNDYVKQFGRVRDARSQKQVERRINPDAAAWAGPKGTVLKAGSLTKQNLGVLLRKALPA